MAKLYFRYGAMNCGKTTAIIQVAHNYEERDKKVLVIKSNIDTKGNDTIINRTGNSRKVDILLPQDVSLKPLIKNNIDAILVDEAQFLSPNQVDELYEISKLKDIPVLCYGLRTDFRHETFPGAARLLAISDTIEEIKTICRCGKKATVNVRLKDGIPTFTGEQVAIDGENNITYEPMCGYCYLKYKEGINYER